MMYSASTSVDLFRSDAFLRTHPGLIEDTLRANCMPYVYVLAALVVVLLACNTRVLRVPQKWLTAAMFVVAAAFSIGSAAIALQLDAFANIRAASQEFTRFTGTVNSTVGTVTSTLLTCTPFATNQTFDAYGNFPGFINYLQSEFSEYYDDATSYSDDILTVTVNIQLSMVMMYLVVVLVAVCVVCGWLIVGNMQRLTYVNVYWTLFVIAVLCLISGGLLSVLRLQANVCHEPAVSIINTWDIDNQALQYYFNCTVDDTLVSPYQSDFDTIEAVARDIIDLQHRNLSHCPLVSVAENVEQLLREVSCAAVTRGPRKLVAAVCVESFNAVLMLYIIFTVLIALLTGLGATIKTT